MTCEALDGGLHERILLRPPFAHPRFIAIGTMGIDHQSDQNLVVSCGGEPAQRIEKANPVHVDVLALGCLPHDEAHQIVNQRKNWVCPTFYTHGSSAI